MAKLTDIKGIGEELAAELNRNGYTLEFIAAASIADLTAISGIGPSKAWSIISQAKDLASSETPPQPQPMRANTPARNFNVGARFEPTPPRPANVSERVRRIYDDKEGGDV